MECAICLVGFACTFTFHAVAHALSVFFFTLFREVVINVKSRDQTCGSVCRSVNSILLKSLVINIKFSKLKVSTYKVAK